MNRPKALNALSPDLLGAVADALRAADADDSIRAVVLTGSDRAFSAGADLKALDGLTVGDILDPNGFTSGFEIFNRYRKPLIAAVRGLALGGGFEIAMACDTVIAGESAQFGLPEVKVGLIPGAGGTQRLMHAVGKAKALALLLSGDTMTAAEAATAGVVASVVPDDQCVAAAVALATRIAANGPWPCNWRRMPPCHPWI